MYNKAKRNAKNAVNNYEYIEVSKIDSYKYDEFNQVRYFTIKGENDTFVVYQIDADIYYRPADEFYNIIKDFIDEVPGQTIEGLKTEYTDVSEPLIHFSITDIDNCMFIISSIFSSLCGDSYDELTENAKIRKHTKIHTDNDIDLSKSANDAKYGTKEENDFKQELEDKQKKDGTTGALDPQQEESYKPKLPNVNLLTEKNNIEYEVNDKVIFNDEIWDVFSIVITDDDKQHLKITRNGEVVDIEASKVKPEPNMLKDLELMTNNFEFDKNKLNVTPKNEKP